MRQSLNILILVFASFSAFGQQASYVDSLMFDAEYGKATEWLDKQLVTNLNPDLRVMLLGKKADALIRLGKFTEAGEVLANASALATTYYQRAVLQTSYGALYLNQGLYDQCLNELQSALQNLEKDKRENSAEAAQVLSHLGNLYRATGKYAQAEEQLSRVLAIRQKFFKENTEWIAASYNDLGLVFSQIDNDKALAYYEMAAKIYERLHGKDHPKIAIANTNIAFIYSSLELYGDATNNFESALKTWERIYPQPHPTKAFLLFNLGETYSKIHNPEVASEYYQKALTMYQQTYGNKHPDLAVVFNALGNINLSSGRFDEALVDYQKALISNVRNFESTDKNVNPALQEYYNGRTLLNTLLYKALALESMYYGRTIRFSDLKLALKTLQLCDTLVDNLRQHITNEADKLSLGSIASDVYASSVRIAFEAAEVAAKKDQWYSLCFYFAEKSKSAVLLEAISDVNAKSFARIPDNLLDEEKKLKAGIALVTQQLAQKPSAVDEKILREKNYQLNRQYETFTSNLEKQYPQYFNLKYSTTSPSIRDLQAKVNHETAIVSYFIDDKNSQLYQFLITNKKYKVTVRPVSMDLDKEITGLRNSLYFNSTDTYKRAATALSSVLVPKHIPAAIKSLVIIPTGRLSIIPFETLFSSKVKQASDLTSLPYLLTKYSIRYEFSASLILQKAIAKPSSDKSIFLCAPVTFTSHGLNELPGTESEVREISELFTKHNFKSSTYLREHADESIAKSSNLKAYNFLHFATHGIVDEKNPELSRIYLQSRNTSEDGSLFTGEIYNLDLDAELVTLSACQTGLGKISKGEGVIGLSRALVYAGARNIMVSFWSVADESTAVLMKDFYRFTLDGKERIHGDNLRLAKLQLMQNAKYSSPYYWAPFVMIGY